MILAGDVGGTKTQLGLFEHDGRRWTERRAARVESRQYDGLPELVRDFLAGGDETPDVTHVAFGVAGPVVDGRCEATNLSWVVDARDLAPLFGALKVLIVNDLVATAAGVLGLEGDQLATVYEGIDRGPATRALLAPGTGLGQAILFWDRERYHAVPSEGGHADWAARDDESVALLRWARERYGRVSCERVLAGPGIAVIYEFLRDTGRETEDAETAAALAQAEDRNEAITQRAIARRSPLCRHALDRWLTIFGAATGNWALQTVSQGGVYLAGGIVPNLVDELRSPTFLDAYLDKPPLDDLLRTIPVRAVLEPKAAYYGAARLALAGSPDAL